MNLMNIKIAVGIASANREIPIVKREKIEIKLLNTGEVEMFSESLIPSIQTADINESLPSTNPEVKFQHYKNGVMHLYDAKRKLLDEFEMPEINQLFNEVFVQIQNGAIDESYFTIYYFWWCYVYDTKGHCHFFKYTRQDG